MAQSKYFIEYNANPYNLDMADCSIRALTKMFDIPYYYAYALFMENQTITNEPVYNMSRNIENLLTEQLGMIKHEFKGTVNRLCTILSEPAYVHVKEHAICCENKKFYDTWDSGRKHVECYFTIGEETYKLLETKLNNIKGMG